jgi:hypothetical protein
MTNSFAGGCECGAIRFVCSNEPLVVFSCHCPDCHKTTSDAFATLIALCAFVHKSGDCAPLNLGSMFNTTLFNC